MTVRLTAVMLLFLANTALANDYDRALATQAEEMATCAAYYTLCYSALEMDREAAPENMMALDAGERAMEFSLMMSNRELSETRVEQSMKEMLSRLGGDFSNLSSIIDEHGEQCKNAVENPFERLKYWLAQNRKD